MTDCVDRLIHQVVVLDRILSEQLPRRKTSTGGDPQKRRDLKTWQADYLTQRTDELNKQATHLKETLSRQTEQFSLGKVLGSVIGLLVLSGFTCWLITKFMHQVYEEGGNLFQEGYGSALTSCSDQLSNEARHYSHLRFAMLTIFIAISGGLGTIDFSRDFENTTKPIRDIIPITGLLMTVIFASLEFAIDWRETEYYYMARASRRHFIIAGSVFRLPSVPHLSTSFNVRGITYSMEWVRCPIWAIFYLSAFLWLFILSGYHREEELLGIGFLMFTEIGFLLFLWLGGTRIRRRVMRNI